MIDFPLSHKSSEFTRPKRGELPPDHKFPPIRQTAKTHIDWKLLRTYKALYRSSKGDEITIRSVRKPPRTKVLRSAMGQRKYKLVKLQTSLREVIIVAKTKNRKKPVEADEIEELEALEELEEDEDLEDDEDVEDADVVDEDEDDEPEDEDEDEDDDEEEAPPKRSRSKKSAPAKKAAKPRQSRAAAEGKVGTAEVAEHFGIDGRTLRMLLRKHQIPTDPDSGRYQWSSLNHKQVVRIGKLIKSGEAKRAKREQLDNLKSKKSTKKAASKTSTKKRSRKSDEDDD